MISITCTNCQAKLTIDDAFAGGVCRCQFCGAIQTVPKPGARAARPAAPGLAATTSAAATGQRTLYFKKTATQGDPETLGDLADVVSDSGMTSSNLGSSNQTTSGQTGSGLGSAPVRRRPKASSSVHRKLMPLFIVGGVIVLGLTAALVWLSTRNHETTEPVSNNTPAAHLVPAGPVFLGISLEGSTIIYVIDRGQATHTTFDYAKLAVLKSLNTLRPDQKFQVIFWKTKDLTLYPQNGPVTVTPKTIDDCQKAIEEVYAFAASDLKPAIEKALKANPSAIVIATGKPLNSDFTKIVLDARKNSPVHIHCVSLAETSSATAMRAVAEKTGGTYREISMDDLINATR
jgi:hypothetical protein